MNDARIRWLCRRGMKELDVMLARYLDARWADAPAAERAAFASLLELQDPLLWDLMMARDTATDADQHDVVERIRALSGI
ncbi:MAG: succinate dehydrogenase assembly factor 2 [Gammaproteobacteria bacterium]